MENVTEYVANKIKEFRERKNVTQQELAEALNTTQQSIARYESGERKADQNVLFALANYFKVSINEFFPPIETFTSYALNDSMGTNYISETQLALMSGVDISEIRRIVSGDEKIPKPQTLIKLANVLNENPYDLLISAGYIEDPTDPDNTLFNSNIRYLLSADDRIYLCNYLKNKWSENKEFTFNSDDIYQVLFKEDLNQKDIDATHNNFSNNLKDVFLKYHFDNGRTIELPKRIVKIPVLGSIKAGTPIEAQEDVLEYINIPEDWTRGGKKFYGLYISGDSMYPDYKEKDIVIFEQSSDTDKANNKDCAVMVNGFDATFKRVNISENGIMLTPLNANNSDGYQPTFYSIEQIMNLPVKIIGIGVEKRTRL